jgi:predicted nucleotidyltransferase
MKDVALEKSLQEVAAAAPDDVLAAYLFGSRARGSAGAGSDLDLGVLLRSAPPPRLKGVARDLEDLFERAVRIPVQVVVLNTAPADLVHRVLRDGVLVLDRDRSARIRFEVQSRNEYFDLAPLRRLYRRVPA